MEEPLDVERGTIVVRFEHPVRDLQHLAQLLELPCFRCWKAGSPRFTPRGEPLEGIYKNSYWIARSSLSLERGFRAQIVGILDLLIQHSSFLADHIESGGSASIGVELFGHVNNGDVLQSSELRKMALLGLDLGVEVFPNR